MSRIDVVVAVLFNTQQEVLISRRHSHQHQGGLWEFPGGKREADESILQALKREIAEELGVEVEQAEPFVQIEHDYGDKQVNLDVWLVTAFSGVPRGREGQPLRWLAVEQLTPSDFPAANVAIIDALKLR